MSSQKRNTEDAFYNTLPGIIDSLIASRKISPLPEVGTWIKKLLEYNLLNGKHRRGLMVTIAYETLEKPENITEEYMKLSRILGWCAEILQSQALIVDDMMDGATTRRGLLCWYKKPDVGMSAANDAILMYCCIMDILEINFVKTPYFTDLVKLFNETALYIAMGQRLDVSMAQRAKHDYTLFTIERYNTITKYKTSFYTFTLPYRLGLTLIKDINKKTYTELGSDLNFKVGNLFQMQDDYLDCYGDEAITGKVGTDIQEGKCSWLAVTALQHCNETQREVFTKYYSSSEPEHIAIIKNLYNELRLPELFKYAEMELYSDIVRCIQALPSSVAQYFDKVVHITYKRNR